MPVGITEFSQPAIVAGFNGYNDAFKAFTDFAEQSITSGKSTAIARVVGEGPLAGRKIASAKSDWTGIGIGRLSSLKNANNIARNLFAKSVADMFGGMDKVPDSVKDAMKLDDYGKGKPLTARRIAAVKAAIDFVTAPDNAINYLHNLTPVENMTAEARAELDACVRDIFETCDNADAREIIEDKIKEICIRGDGVMRSLDKIKAKADAIKANFAELKAAAKGNRHILEAGKILISRLGGSSNSLPPGLIGRLVASATGKDVKLDVVRRLNARTGPVTTARALIQLDKNVNAVLQQERETLLTLDNGANYSVSDFVEHVMLQKLGANTMRSVQKAISGANVTHLANLSDVFKTESVYGLPIDPGEINQAIMGDSEVKVPAGLGDKIRDLASELFTSKLNGMRMMVSTITGVKLDNPPDLEGELPGNTTMILEDLGSLAKELLEAKKEEYLNRTVSGDSPKAELMHEILSDNIGEYCDDPQGTVLEGISNETLKILGGKLESRMAELADGRDDLAGLKDFAQISIGGKLLPGDANSVKDGIAQLVSGGKTKAFDSLQGVELRKARMLLSFLSQETHKAVADGFLEGLYDERTPDLFDSAALTPEVLEKAGTRIDFSINAEGSLIVKFDTTIPVKEPFGGDDRILPGGDDRAVRLDLGFKFQVHADEFTNVEQSGKVAPAPENVRLESTFKANFDKEF